MAKAPLALIPGTLDLLILRAAAPAARHGYGITEFIREASGGTFDVVEGALYQALHRLEHQGFLSASWGSSENNRRAKFYALTATGRRRLVAESAVWKRYAAAMNTVLGIA